MVKKFIKPVMIFFSAVLLIISTVTYLSNRPISAADSGFTIERDHVKEMKINTAHAIAEWKSSGPILVSFPGGSFEVPRSQFEFDIEQSYQALENAIHTPWFAFWERNDQVTFPLTAELDDTYLADYSEMINVEQTKEQLLMLAERLVYQDLNQDAPEQTAASQPITVQLSSVQAKAAADLLSSLVIDADSQFSFNSMIADDTEAGLVAASALYQLFLQSDAKIIERHAALQPPSYTKPGFEASVSLKENKDLKIYNPTDFSMTIESRSAGDQLSVALITAKQPTYILERVQSDIVKPRTIKRYSNLLEPGEELQLQKGSDGYQVEVYRVELASSEVVEEDSRVTKQFYAPVPTIIEVSSVAPAQSAEPAVNETEDQTDITNEESNQDQNNGNDNGEAGEQPDSKNNGQPTVKKPEENNPK
ncbi:VanW family protein [Jeotgalibacillus haloalkalitolerans]|uniref:VanW family protein n=1 Tax=Jeotgalibacillus haloalkalitolerans TaxID=3104292 RepID=A0ABU5KM71_9BACL|nr:VanW family protein [Jeotgalibacillus sp. HH7-29]MDZ5712370.1 VanW family protein [Jeotgalibacillus sp. HH7-29]